MSRFKDIIFAAAVFSLAGGFCFAQSDTILVRTREISVPTGNIAPGADTVVLEDVVLPQDRVIVPADMAAEADRLRQEYRFSDAIALYTAAASLTADESLIKSIQGKYSLAQNGLNMTDFCASPVVVARQNVPLKDFMLFYPLKNGSWRQCPNVLDTTTVCSVPQAVYMPKDAKSIYFSAPEGSGSRNIYFTNATDSLWTAPALLGEALFSEGNEIFPMLSLDGKKLYFASDALYGMGGYDLYYSVWDEVASCWGEPQNMGFPYSSPYDDFLFIDTEDGKYSIFASTRDCDPGTVNIYVLEYEDTPLRRPVQDIAELKELSALSPLSDPSRIDNASAVESSISAGSVANLYRDKMQQVRALRDSVYAVEKDLDALRLKVAETDNVNLGEVASRIEALEKLLPLIRDSLKVAGDELRATEMEFLSIGVVDGREKADREVVGAASAYTFTKNTYGARPRIKMSVRETPEDNTFRIAPVGRFAKDNTLPEGIIYQIRFMTRPSHAGIDDLCGLTPVYERITSSLKYTYSVGLFTRYNDALDNLNAVRRLGFKDAAIVAYRDGRQVSISEAVKLEK